MTTLQYKVLVYMLYHPRTIEQALAHVNRFRLRKIKRSIVERAFQTLEENNVIEPLGHKERERLISTGQETTGTITDFDGSYLATEDYGVELGESLRDDRRRFYTPFVFSAVFTVLSILISLLALLVSFSQIPGTPV